MSMSTRMHELQKKRPSGSRSSATKSGFKRSYPAGETTSHAKKKVGGYLIGDTVGEGSFAKVKSATHILTQERVAIKVIDKKLIAKRDYVRRNLRREAAMLQKLRHPHICQLYEVMETSNNYYLIIEFADGGEFMKYLCEKRKLSERECRKYIRQLVSAVDHMHRADIIHRDIKVENFLLDEDMNLKVIDFGLSNMLGPDGLLATQCGSPAYAAPEIFCNSSYGPAVDVWSIGVNMYAMLTGELPFVVDPPNNMTKLHARILQGCDIPVHLTKDCQDLLSKLMRVNEKQRITISEIMKHPWTNRGYTHSLKPATHPVKLTETIKIDEHILSTMKDCGYNEDDVREIVLSSKPLSENASYYLTIKRLSKGWGNPEGHDPAPSCIESTFEQSPRPDSPDPPSPSPVVRVNVRPLSGKIRSQQNNGNGNVSEMNRRNDQARKLKSPVVGEDYGECNMGPSRISATISIVRSPSKESIFEDMKRTLEKSMTNLDINNNNTDKSSDLLADDDDDALTTVQLNTPEPDRELDSSMSTTSTNRKIASIVCDKHGKMGTLSRAYLQGKPAAEHSNDPDAITDDGRSTSKRTRLFHRRTEKERRQSVSSNKSNGCIVIVNGKLTDTGEHDLKPRAISRIEGQRSVSREGQRSMSRADVPDRIGSTLSRGDVRRSVSMKMTPRSRDIQQMQRPHTEGSVDIGRGNGLSMSPYSERGIPDLYPMQQEHPKQGHPPARPANGRQRRHQRSFTAPNPSRYYGSLPTPQRHLATAPSGNHGYMRSIGGHGHRTTSDGGLPSIFISSFKNV